MHDAAERGSGDLVQFMPFKRLEMHRGVSAFTIPPIPVVIRIGLELDPKHRKISQESLPRVTRGSLDPRRGKFPAASLRTQMTSAQSRRKHPVVATRPPDIV